MKIGEANHHPTVHVPPWALFDDSTAGMTFAYPVSGVSVNSDGYANGATEGGGEYSPFSLAEPLTALRLYLPSSVTDSESDKSGRESDIPVDAYSSEEFRIYEFKVRRCIHGRSHDWTECPYAHPGEKARRRDPRKFHYSGTACPDFRNGNCERGDLCEFAHGVFECWLHPARYRTQPCKDGTSCRRRVCFFAHTPEQLRVRPQQSPRTPVSDESYDGSPLRHALDSCFSKGSNSFMEMVSSLRHLGLSSSWGCSTPTPSGIGYLDSWERVESGRDLRAKIYEKLSRENSLERVDSVDSPSFAHDDGWVSELVK
ncbi:hypothetical protein HHK36_019932 [Tetracentron sinense]|uniref:C3H1-type domain-containing protein n=1 Tax=Tetracentron sinense TaxID=13715 RepID=A0A834YQS0_TETSI|nr:hypothetical protein HHK36_019932 [Tetracentron sinense]